MYTYQGFNVVITYFWETTLSLYIMIYIMIHTCTSSYIYVLFSLDTLINTFSFSVVMTYF